MLPTATEANATVDGLEAICPCAPVPDIEIVVGEFGALLTIEIVPVALPPVVGANCAVNEVLCPAVKVFGVASPLMLKPVPEAEACEIVKLAAPLFVKVTVCELVAPMATEPKVIAEGLTPSWPCAPVPDMEIVVGEFGASLTIEIVPVALPPVVGANCAVNEVLCPAVKVFGVASPLMLKPVPETVAWEIVKLAAPLFVKVTVCELVAPVATEPKVIAEGLTPSWPCAPVPDMEIVVGEFGALLTIEIVPVALPPVVGANCAVNDTLCPAVKVFGVASPLMLKPVPETVAWEIVKLATPLFVKVTICEPVAPAATEPKTTVEGEAPS